MQIKDLYTQIIEAKTGTLIPQTINGRTIESKYNPENDSKRLADSLILDGDFIILLGISSGLLLKELSSRYKNKFFMAVENTQKDLSLISNLPAIIELQNNSNIVFSTMENLKEDLVKYFLPVFYNKFQLIEIPAWLNENSEYKDFIQQEIKEGFSLISRDYSVQVHFGKIWNHNILSNLKIYEKIQNNSFIPDTHKTAVILAAGPSLDSNINELISNRDKYFLIATDTAMGPLLKRKTSPDIAVSLDGQYISSSHYLHKIQTDTKYFFDICGNPSAVKKVFNTQKDNLFFFTTGHPLGALINKEYNNPFISLSSGSGTVTIAALDLAWNLGFKNIQVYGADFSYIKGKAYTSGTYLDSLYNSTSNKTISVENLYSKLMFRTALQIKSKDAKTTEVLEGYRSSFEAFIISRNMELISYKNNIYNIENNNSNKQNFEAKTFEYTKWFENFVKKVSDHPLNNSKELKFEDIAILPLMSSLKNYDNKSNTGLNDLHNLAIKALKR